MQDARTKLLDGYFAITDIRSFKDKDWDELHIPKGLGARLQREAKAFIRIRDLARSRSSSTESQKQARTASNQDTGNTTNLDVLADAARLSASRT